MQKIKVSVWAGAIVIGLGLQAGVEFGTPFTDGVVLQRDRRVPIWGTATAGEKVRVSFKDQTVTTTADEKGYWRTELEPMPACKEGGVLKAEGLNATSFWLPFKESSDVARVEDVLVGEVWLCAGQSNTDCPIMGPNPHYRDGQGAMHVAMTVKPWVRLVKTPLQWHTSPRTDYKAKWVKMTPELAKMGRKPSAMGWYFALELACALDIPVGLVDSSWGGTNIDAWTPPSGLASIPELSDVAALPLLAQKDFDAARKNGGIYTGKNKGIYGGPQQQPSALWNGMVAAYVPMAIRGFIWYQGCHNSGEPQRYASKMQALYNGWAKEFVNPELKLYFVQLAPWGSPGIAAIQEAQAAFAARESHAAMAVINDAGNLADIHPADKRVVAKRLAFQALARDYGFTGYDPDSPTLRTWKIEGDKFVLSFAHVKGWYLYNPDWDVVNGFEVAGADNKWYKAEILNLKEKTRKGYKSQGVILGVDLEVRAKEVPAPKKLRYLHSAPWYGSLKNELDLPLGAFHIGE